MQANTRFQITSKQVIFIIVGTILGISIFSLPRSISAYAKQNAWICMILGIIIPALSLVLINILFKRFDSLTMVEISNLVFGNFLGRILSIGFILFFIAVSAAALRMFAEITSLYLLPETPIAVISLVFILSIIFIISKGGKIVARLNEFLFYILFASLVFILPSLNKADYLNLLPVGGSTAKDILIGSLQTSFSYSGIEILFIIYPMITKKDETLKAGFTALGICMFVYLLSTVTCLLVFGYEYMQKFLWPALVLFKITDIPVIQRLELFFLFVWVGIGIRPVVNNSFSASFSIAQLLNLDINRYYRIICIVVSVIVYLCSFIPTDIIQVFVYFNYIGYVFIIIAIGYPLLFIVVSSFKKERLNEHA